MLDSGFQSPGFRIPQAKNSWIPESGFPYMGRLSAACNKRKLERMQEKALRALFLDRQSSSKAPLDKGDLITLQNRRLKDIAILMYKVKHKLCPTKISELFHMHWTPYNLRVAVFAIPRFKTEKYDKHSLTYLGPKLRNRLPGEIRILPTSDEF